MVNTCCVVHCKSQSKKGSGISFFSFPTDETLSRQWVAAIGRDGFIPTKFSKICSKHFADAAFSMDTNERKRLLCRAVPTEFFMAPSPQKQKKKERKIQKRSHSPSPSSEKHLPTVLFVQAILEDSPSHDRGNCTPSSTVRQLRSRNVVTKTSVKANRVIRQRDKKAKNTKKHPSLPNTKLLLYRDTNLPETSATVENTTSSADLSSSCNASEPVVSKSVDLVSIVAKNTKTSGRNPNRVICKRGKNTKKTKTQFENARSPADLSGSNNPPELVVSKSIDLVSTGVQVSILPESKCLLSTAVQVSNLPLSRAVILTSRPYQNKTMAMKRLREKLRIRNRRIHHLERRLEFLKEAKRKLKKTPLERQLAELRERAEQGDLSAIFLIDQIRCQKQSSHFSDATIQFCSLLKAKSAPVYEFIRRSKVLKIPGRETIRRHGETVLSENGVAPPIFTSSLVTVAEIVRVGDSFAIKQ